ncbi:MAG: hypothetical protein HYZ46_00880 [Nitrosomonadales bacterium]|nr:hypothetical protein [Nitrosomonadales bacterium]
MKQIVQTVSGINLFAFVFLIWITPATAGNYHSEAEKKEVESLLLQAAEILNKTLPKMESSDMRSDSVSGENGEFHYRYTFVNSSFGEINVDVFNSTTRPGLLNNLCTNSNMETARRFHIPMLYDYFDKNGEKITSIRISSDECIGAAPEKSNSTKATKGVFQAAIGGFGAAILLLIGAAAFFVFKKARAKLFGKQDAVTQAGKLAFSNGLQQEDNPYSDDQEAMKAAWRKGWELGKAGRESWADNLRK